MPAPVVDVAWDRPRLSAAVWGAAVVEVAVAAGVATIVFGSRSELAPSHAGEGGMHGMLDHGAIQVHWGAGALAIAVVTGVTSIGWLFTRSNVAALLSAVGLVALSVSEPVRAITLQSHLLGMAALEVLLAGVPLLVVTAVRPWQPTRRPRWSQLRSGGVILAVAFYAVLLIVLHLPTVHARGVVGRAIPVWLPLLVAVVGLAYWAAILLTAGQVKAGLRRSALVIGQEVAAILGLAFALHPSSGMHHTNVLGLTPAMDQRFGGVLMLVTCAAVTLPLLRAHTAPSS